MCELLVVSPGTWLCHFDSKNQGFHISYLQTTHSSNAPKHSLLHLLLCHISHGCTQSPHSQFSDHCFHIIIKSGYHQISVTWNWRIKIFYHVVKTICLAFLFAPLYVHRMSFSGNQGAPPLPPTSIASSLSLCHWYLSSQSVLHQVLPSQKGSFSLSQLL